MQILSLSLALIMSTPLVSAHFKIINATGDMGGNASALGVLAMDNSQNDVTKFKRKDDKSSGNLFGTLTQGGQIDVVKSLATMQQKDPSMILPQVTMGGTLSMFVRQLNGDGAGPVNCTVSTDASGKGIFANTTMVKDVPGQNGISQANNKNFPLVVKMPELPCTGTIGSVSNACVVQCQNAIQFGGNVVVQMVGAGASAGSGNVTMGQAGNKTVSD